MAVVHLSLLPQRQTLEVLSFLSGVGFIPYKYNTGARSMLISKFILTT